jgi:hypothetical protein
LSHAPSPFVIFQVESRVFLLPQSLNPTRLG